MKVEWFGGPKCGDVLEIPDETTVVEYALKPHVSPFYAESYQLADPPQLEILVVPVDVERKLLLWYEGKLKA